MPSLLVLGGGRSTPAPAHGGGDGLQTGPVSRVLFVGQQVHVTVPMDPMVFHGVPLVLTGVPKVPSSAPLLLLAAGVLLARIVRVSRRLRRHGREADLPVAAQTLLYPFFAAVAGRAA